MAFIQTYSWRAKRKLQIGKFEVVKVNSVQEACAKRFAVHILEFEILQITWKNKTKNITLSFQFFINKSSILMLFVLCFHVVCKISNIGMWTAKHLMQASCTELTLKSSFWILKSKYLRTSAFFLLHFGVNAWLCNENSEHLHDCTIVCRYDRKKTYPRHIFWFHRLPLTKLSRIQTADWNGSSLSYKETRATLSWSIFYNGCYKSHDLL